MWPVWHFYPAHQTCPNYTITLYYHYTFCNAFLLQCPHFPNSIEKAKSQVKKFSHARSMLCFHLSPSPLSNRADWLLHPHSFILKLFLNKLEFNKNLIVVILQQQALIRKIQKLLFLYWNKRSLLSLSFSVGLISPQSNKQQMK